MAIDIGTVEQLLRETVSFVGAAGVEVANFLEADNPVSKLAKDTLTAILIAAFSSTVINWLIQRRERKKREEEEKPIRSFVLEAISAAHSGVRQAIADFNRHNGKHIETRLRRLGDQLSSVRAVLSASVLSGFGFFESAQKTAIAEYMAGITFEKITTIDQAERWVDEINSRFKRVMKLADASSNEAWSTEDVSVMKAHLARLGTSPVEPSHIEATEMPSRAA